MKTALGSSVIYYSIMKPIIVKSPMDGTGSTIKNVVFCQVRSGQIIINSAENLVRLQASFALQLPRCLKNQVWSLVNLVILKKHQSYQEHLRFTSSHDVLLLQPEKLKSIFSSYRIVRNLVVIKNRPPKEDSVT